MVGVGLTKFIDLKGISLSSTAVTVDGVYEAIEGNIGKIFALCNVNYEGVDKGSAFVAFTAGTDAFTTSLFGKTITITDEDAITIA